MGVSSRWWWSLAFAFIALATSAMAAEEPNAPSHSGDGAAPARDHVQESRKLLEEVLMARLTKELALDEEQTILMVRHLAEYRERLAAMRRDRMQTVRSLKQAVRESADEARIEALLDELLKYDEKIALARRDLLEPNGLELTTWQRARLALFINDFEGDMRRLLNQAQERRMNGGPRPRRAVDGNREVNPMPRGDAASSSSDHSSPVENTPSPAQSQTP